MTKIRLAKWGKFYKYGAFKELERVKSMLCKGEFYFPTPSLLNDPSDCRNTLQNCNEEEIEKFLIEANELFYGKSRVDVSNIKAGIRKFGSATLLEEMAKRFNTIMDSRYGVFSLAKRPDNLALWAKYADDYKGYCLEFDNLLSFTRVYEVNYEEKIPLSISMQLDPTQADFLYTKSREWSNEEEARILSTPGYKVFPRDALKSIIIGSKCHESIESQITSWVKECNKCLVVKKVKFNSVAQKIEFLTIKSS